GILHRDIKPDNFLLDSSGRVRLADLGLARLQNKDNNAHLTQDGEAMGTPHYMSPEQCRGTEVDTRSDLYSLGASMFVMASGETPYEANSAAAVMVKVLTEPPRSLKKLAPHLSPGFVALVEKLMAKEPARRFADAAQVLEAIEKCKTGAYKGATAGHARIPTGPVAPVAQPRFKLMLYGAGAAVLALVAIGIVARPKDDKQPEKVATAPAAVNPEPAVPAKSDPKKTETTKSQPPKAENPKPEPGKTDTKVELPSKSVLTEDVNVLDMKPEHQKAVRALSVLKRELQEKTQSNPDVVIERLEQFIKQHPNSRIADIAAPMLKEAKEAKEKLEKDWEAAKEEAEHEIADNKKDRAFRMLRKFADKHENSKQAAEAHGMMRGLLGELRARAAKAAEAGNYDKAIEMLDGPTNRLPAEITDALKKDIEKYQAEQRKIANFTAEDLKSIAAMYEKAGLRVTEIEVGGRRYNFDEAGKLIRDGAEKLHTEPFKKAARTLADIYLQAGNVWKQMAQATNDSKGTDLPGLGKYPAGQLIGWSDKELTYKPTNASGLPPQPVPWKLITPENLIQLAQALKVAEKDTPTDHLNMGALAFALGLKELASEHLQKVGDKDPNAKAMAELGLKMLGPAQAPVNREAQARQLYSDVLDARKNKDLDGALKLQQRLIVEFVDTEFVQQNRKQIEQLAQPLAASEPESKPEPKSKEKEPEAKKPEGGEKPATTPAVLSELKRLNWTEVKGEWTTDPKLKGVYTVTGGGMLVAPLVDGAVQVRFLLEEGASIEVLTRYEAETELTKKIRRDAEEYDLTVGKGYGIHVKGEKLTYFGDPTRAQFETGSSKAKFAKVQVPLSMDSKTIQPGPHVFTVSARGDHLEMTFDEKVLARSSDSLRPSGSIVIIVEGNAKLDSPIASK
ncbi:MAG TPA: protein kinase, partial [Planctomycetota bacterium]|nr:protein kinase [Planctomycetota bacterium]